MVSATFACDVLGGLRGWDRPLPPPRIDEPKAQTARRDAVADFELSRKSGSLSGKLHVDGLEK
jgi:hypothetical protein